MHAVLRIPCMASYTIIYVIHTIYVCVYIVEQNNGMICNLGITNYFTTSSATFFLGGGGGGGSVGRDL